MTTWWRSRIPRALFVLFVTIPVLSPGASAQARVISRLSFVSGPPGAKIDITGSGFGTFTSFQNNRVAFNSVPGIVLGWTDSLIQVEVPLSATTGPVTVINNGDLSFGPIFTVVRPRVDRLEFTSGPVGAKLQVVGLGFGGFQMQVNWCSASCDAQPGDRGRVMVFLNGKRQIPFGNVHLTSAAPDGSQSLLEAMEVTLGATTGPVEVRLKAFDLRPDGTCCIEGFVSSDPGPVFTVVSPRVDRLEFTSGPVGAKLQVFGTGLGGFQMRVNWCRASCDAQPGDRGRVMVFLNGKRQIPFGNVHLTSAAPDGSQSLLEAMEVTLNATTGPVEVRLKAFDLRADGTCCVEGFVSSGPGPVFTVVSPRVDRLEFTSGPVSTKLQVLGAGLGGFQMKVNWCSATCDAQPGDRGRVMVFLNGKRQIPFGNVHLTSAAPDGSQSLLEAMEVTLGATTGPVEVRLKAFDLRPDGTCCIEGLVSSGPGPVFTMVSPEITSVSSTSVSVGTPTSLFGSAFGRNPLRENQVLFSDIPGRILSWSDATVSAQVPIGVKAGAVPVTALIRARDLRADGTCCLLGFESSNTVTFFSATNTPPVANAGPDQTVSVGEVVTLGGSASFDVNGDLLTYAWTLVSAPAGSRATLSDPTHVNPQFQVDKAGAYVAQLVVNDGFADSEPDTVTVSTTNSAPVADAGLDQGVTLGQILQLRGDGSFDIDGDALAFSWSLTAVPAGSAATLSDPTAANPTFVADVFGIYEAVLIVHDGQVASKPDTVVVTTANVRPAANAGPDQAVAVQHTAFLDGRGSIDPEGVALLFSWSFASRPAGSLAVLSDAASSTPTFVPDVVGTYVVQLIVSDGLADSQPDTASITAVSSGSVLGHLKNAINLLSAMPAGAFVNPNRGRALINKLEAVVRRIEHGHLAAARHQLREDLLPKLDGCAARKSAGRPTSGKLRDWITDCEAQRHVHAEVKDALDALVLLIGA